MTKEEIRIKHREYSRRHAEKYYKKDIGHIQTKGYRKQKAQQEELQIYRVVYKYWKNMFEAGNYFEGIEKWIKGMTVNTFKIIYHDDYETIKFLHDKLVGSNNLF